MARRTGKIKKVMIACVTFETVKVTDPVREYGCSDVHIIHQVNEGVSDDNVFLAFYNRVVELLKEDNPDVVIHEHNEKVSYFSRMLSTVLSIIEKEKKENGEDCFIYVNISAGTPEYSAAAAIGAMMFDNTIPFSVYSSRFTISTDEELRKAYFKDGKPIGLT